MGRQQRTRVVHCLSILRCCNQGEMEVLDYLTDWLKEHILQEDRKFGVYFVNRGFHGHAVGAGKETTLIAGKGKG